MTSQCWPGSRSVKPTGSFGPNNKLSILHERTELQHVRHHTVAFNGNFSQPFANSDDQPGIQEAFCEQGQVLRQRQSEDSPAEPDWQALTAQMPAETHSWWQKLHGLMNLHQAALHSKTTVC